MATYIVLMKFTDQGARAVKDTVKRAQAAEQAAKGYGVTFKSLHWTQGQYDLVAVIEAANEAAATTWSLILASQGNISSQTLRAFNADEMKGFIAKMP
jgi:uncharacterized protein with GYD domain